MRRASFVILLLVALAARSQSELRVGTANTYWLTDPQDARTSSLNPYEGASAAVRSRHLNYVADQLAALRADVWCLQEVDEQVTAEALAARMAQNHRVVFREGDDSATEQDVAVLSTLQVVSSRVTTDRVTWPLGGSRCGSSSSSSSSTGVSKNLLVTLRLPDGRSLEVVCAHLKSGGGSDNCARREAQARVLRDFSARADLRVVMGDMNEFSRDLVDARGRTADGDTVNVLSEGLSNVANAIPVSQRYTASIGMIDHIFYSPALQLAEALIDHSSEQDARGESGARVTSDHYPLLASFRLDASSSSSGSSSSTTGDLPSQDGGGQAGFNSVYAIAGAALIAIVAAGVLAFVCYKKRSSA